MYVIGTAGHVDHGKSTLIYALTGTDPDRLSEEKERGLTIDLGFAWLELPSKKEISIIDVPGHERFVRNMLAGVGYIDLALLVIAANESVMPQTKEHLSILQLLGINNVLVVISKKDTLEEDLLELVIAEIEELISDTSIVNPVIVSVSAITGEGMDKLVSTIDAMLDDIQPKIDIGKPRLFVDRNFSMAGFGTVVTGTLIGGSISVGEDVQILPSTKVARIRGLQSHRNKIEIAYPGRRVAINLAGVSQEEVSRGDVITHPGWLTGTQAVDAQLHVLKDSKFTIKHNMSVTFYSGSAETLAVIRLLDSDEALPDQDVWVQLRLQKPMALLNGDHFIIRSSSHTIGGGVIVEPHAKRHRRHNKATIERLNILHSGSEEEIVTQIVKTTEPCDIDEIMNLSELDKIKLTNILNSLALNEEIMIIGDIDKYKQHLIFSADGWIAFIGKITAVLLAYYEDNPLSTGINKESLRTRLGLQSDSFSIAMAKLEQDKYIVNNGNMISSYGHKIQLTIAQQVRTDEYLEALRANPYSPDVKSNIEDGMLNLLVDQGLVIKVNDSIVFDLTAYNDMLEVVLKTINSNGQITVREVRDMFGTSRKYALAFLEYLDKQRITRRIDDIRILR